MNHVITALAVAGALLGLAAAGAAVWLAFSTYSRYKGKNNPEQATPNWHTFTFFDLILFGLGMIGGLILLTDVIAVIRDAEAYPLYHYSYLLTGFVFLLGANFMLMLRLLVTLRSLRVGTVLAPNEQNHPHHAEQAKERVQGG